MQFQYEKKTESGINGKWHGFSNRWAFPLMPYKFNLDNRIA